MRFLRFLNLLGQNTDILGKISNIINRIMFVFKSLNLHPAILRFRFWAISDLNSLLYLIKRTIYLSIGFDLKHLKLRSQTEPFEPNSGLYFLSEQN